MVFIFFFALTRAQSGIPDGLYTYPRAVRVYDAHDIRRLKESNKATQRRKLLGRLLQQGKGTTQARMKPKPPVAVHQSTYSSAGSSVILLLIVPYVIRQ